MRDASDRVWTVRAVVPSDLDGHSRDDGEFQAVFLRASLRGEGGFHVWKPDGVVTQKTHTTTALAVRHAKRLKATRGVEYVEDVKAFDLAPRLVDLVPNDAQRAMVRLGNGWQFAVLAKQTETSRGIRYTLALAEHNRPKPQPNTLHRAGWQHVHVLLVQRLGRLSETQFHALDEMREHYGIPLIRMTYIPRSVGKRVPPKHLPDW